MPRRWSEEENRILYSLAGGPFPALREALLPYHRSDMAILSHAYALGFTSVRQGSVTAGELARTTGYDVTQLERARKALGQAWLRVCYKPRTRTSWYAITDEQVQQIIKYLGNEKVPWAKKYRRCRRCGTSKRTGAQKHCSHGFCRSCQNRKTHRRKMQHDPAYAARWREKCRERMRGYRARKVPDERREAAGSSRG